MRIGLSCGSVRTGGPEGQAFSPHTVEDLGKLFPQLEILDLIGQGGMGAVYKAKQKDLDRLVALKVLPSRAGIDAGFAERFTREARALARLNHPNIVAVYEFGQVEGLHYFIMEYVDGTNLRQVERSGGLEPKQALAIIPQICEALQFAHDEGIVHRDIKPENILLDRKGHVKIADFGLAKILGQRQDQTLTQEGHMMGTPHYMAPEQVEHPQAVDHRADIYSLGVVFYEMLTGELPLGKFAPPSRKVQIDVRLDEVVLRTLEKEPGRRYQQASQVRTEVETIAAGAAKPETRSQKPEQASWVGGQGAGTSESRPGVESGPQTPIQTPRLSRKAIVGACWAFLSFLAAGPAVIVYGTSSVHGVALGSLELFSLAVIMLPGLTAPFGTTILGWMAVAEIRRSRGRLRGLGLALYDGLLFPLLLLNALIIGVGHASSLTAVVGVILTAVIVWLAWRAVRGPEAGAKPEPCPLAHTSTLSRAATAGAVWAIFTVVVELLFALSHAQAHGRTVVGSYPFTLDLQHLSLGGFVLLMAMMLAHAGLIGAPILGWVGVSQVRRSGGRLHGLGMALFAGLLFPLLLLNALILWVGQADNLGAIVGVMLALPIDAVIVWLAWRAVRRPLGPPRATPSTPTRRSRRVGLVLAGFIGFAILCTAILILLHGGRYPAVRPADSPTILRRLATDRVLEAGLAKPQSPWAWQELEQRARSGRLSASEAERVLEGLTAWIRRDYPNGYREPLHWIDGLLRELSSRGLAGEGPVLGFLEAFYGVPSCKPARVREQTRTLVLSCAWRSPWHQDLLGMSLLNEMRTVRIDGREIPWRSVSGMDWGQHEFHGELELPELEPGLHVVTCEVESALVSKGEMTGLASHVPSKDWPPAKRRWIRVCQADLMVYAGDAAIVGLIEDQALDPAASSGLSVSQVIIRRKGPLATAVVTFQFDDTLQVPISFDVGLRVGDRIIPCGRIWRNQRADGSVESGGDQPTADMEPLDPQIQEADVLLTPNPRAVEHVAGIDRIWGREILFSHVPLIRQDLQGVGVRSIDATPPGPAIGEMVLDLEGETMQDIVTALRQRYPVRLCLENLDFDTQRDGITVEQAVAQLEDTAKNRPLTDKENRRLAMARQLLQEGKPKGMLFDVGPRFEGRITADTVEGFLAQLTKDTPYVWRRIDETYILCPRGPSRLMFPVTLKTEGLTVEQAVGKVLDQDPSGSKMGLSVSVARPVKENGEDPCPWLRAKAPPLDLHEVPAMTALCRITAGARPASVWELAGYRDGRHLGLTNGPNSK